MAKVLHTCSGCVPIDVSIIDVYTQMIRASALAEAAAKKADEASLGKAPYIGENGDWWEWDEQQKTFVDTGIQAETGFPSGGIPTTEVVDTGLNMTQAQINQIVIGGNITVNLTATPSPIFVGTERNISLSATCSTAATSIVIKKGSTVLATGSGTSLSASDTITPASSGSTSYTAEFEIGGITKTASRSVSAVYPIRIGTGTEYVDGTPLTSPKTSPAGTYNVTVANDGEYIYFNVPSTMTINGATMGGFAFPLEAAQNKTIDGVSYKSYRSSNTYDAGTMTIVIS